MQVQVIRLSRNINRRKQRVCIYIRESTDAVELENSMENQVRFFTDYVAEHSDWKLIKVYKDFGISGYSNKREQFQEMMQDARDGKFDLVIVKSVSRFARNTMTMLEATRELKALGIGVFFYLQNINTLSAEGELMLTLHGAFAQAESEHCRAIGKQAVRQRFERGVPSGKTLHTYGYRAGEGRNLVIYEPEAEIVRIIFKLAGEGVWPTKIRDYLNEKSIPSPTGGKWDRSGIVRILSNVTYKGDLLLGKYYIDNNRIKRCNNGQVDQWFIPNNHPAIVNRSVWEIAQDMLDERREAYYLKPLRKSSPNGSQTRYPLSNLMYCPRCGDKLIHKSSKLRGYWACRTNLKVSASACKGVWIPDDAVKDWDIHEPVVAVKVKDEFGMVHYTAYPKDEYVKEDFSNDSNSSQNTCEKRAH